MVEVLHDDRQVVDGERDGRPQQQQQNERKHQRESERAIVANDLRQFLAGLGENASHVRSFIRRLATLPCWRAFSTTLMKTSSSEKRPSCTSSTRMPLARSFSVVVLLRLLYVVIGDDVQPVAEQRHAPALGVVLQQVRGALRLVDEELQQVAGLAALDAAGSAFGHEFAGDHEAEAIALLGFLEIVSGHQNGGAGIGQPVDHGPEGAARQRIDAGGRLVEKQHARLVHDGGAEGHALLPAAGQAAGDLILLALEAGKREHPLALFLALAFGHAVHAGKKFEIFLNGQIVVERKFLRHVADALAHALRAGERAAAAAGQLNFTARGIEQAAQHLDGGGFARAVGAEQAVDFAVLHFHVEVSDRGERSELLGEIAGADGDLPAQVAVIVPAGKRAFRASRAPGCAAWRRRYFRASARRCADLQWRCRPRPGARRERVALRRIVHQQIQPVAESLHVDDCALLASERREHAFGLAQVGGAQFQAFRVQARTQLRRRAELLNFAQMHERHAVAALGFVQVRRGDQDRQSVRRQVREHIPEFAARDRIDAGGGLVEQQHARLGHQRAHQRQLLFHAAAQPAGQAARRSGPCRTSAGSAGRAPRSRPGERGADRRCSGCSRPR